MAKLHWMCTVKGCTNKKTMSLKICDDHRRGLKKMANDLKKVKVWKPIKKVSEKRQKEQLTYTQLRKKQLEQHPMCQLKLEGCTGQATEVHHSAKRGINYLNAESFLSGCHHCHHILETKLSAKERREKGFLK